MVCSRGHLLSPHRHSLEHASSMVVLASIFFSATPSSASPGDGVAMRNMREQQPKVLMKQAVECLHTTGTALMLMLRGGGGSPSSSPSPWWCLLQGSSDAQPGCISSSQQKAVVTAGMLSTHRIHVLVPVRTFRPALDLVCGCSSSSDDGSARQDQQRGWLSLEEVMCTSGLEGLMSCYKRLKLPLYLRGREVHCVQVDLRNAAYGYDSSCALVEGVGSSGSSSSSSIPRHLSLENVCWSVFVYGSHLRPGFAPPQNQGVLGMEVRASEDDTEMVKCEGGDDNDYDDLDEDLKVQLEEKRAGQAVDKWVRKDFVPTADQQKVLDKVPQMVSCW